MTVAQLKSALTYDELAHWMAYDGIDPIGGYRLDANFAQLAMCQIGGKDNKLSDFILFDPDPISDEERERREIEAERARAKAKGDQLKAQVEKMLERQSDKKTLA